MSKYQNADQQPVETEHVPTLEEALSRPGVRQVMEVYREWQRFENELQPYDVTQGVSRTTDTNRSKIR